MSRQQRRRLEMELRKVGERALRGGLPVPSAKEPVLGLAGLLRSKLRENGNLRRASQAAQIAHEAFEASIRRNPVGVALACGKSCSFCCHTFVSILAPEAFRIADALRGRLSDAAIAEVVSRCEATANKTADERHGAHLPCPLLLNDLCSVYGVRPLVCRKAVSVSVEACKVEYDGGEAGTPMPFINQSLFQDSNLALRIALRSCNLPDHSYELSGALRAALAHAKTEAEWLGGHDIFAGVYSEGRPAEFDSMAEDLADEISALGGS